MSLPLDPTISNPDPDKLLGTLPSQTAFHRALIGAGIRTDPNSGDSTDVQIEHLSPVELQNAVDQIRFAAPKRCFYFQVPRLPHIVGEDLEELTSVNGFGAQIRAVVELHDRLYVICSVPESGSQAQLSVAEDSRVTTVATFLPRTQLLTIRSPSSVIAQSSLQAILNHPTLETEYQLLFKDARFLRRFEDATIDAYTRFTLGSTRSTANVDRIELTAKNQSSAESRIDLRTDDITEDILKRNDTARQSARAELKLDLSLNYEQTGLRRPSVEIDFEGGSIAFQQFVPEDVFIRLDRAILDCI